MKNIYLLFFIIINSTAFGQSILDGFKVMNLPRQNVSLGAEWINEVGPNGQGATTENIIANQSISEYQLDKTIKTNLNLAFLKYLGLSGNYSQSSQVLFKDLKIYTIKDISNLSISSGQSILYEAIKADSIFIKIDKDLDGEVKVKLVENIKEIDVNFNGNIENGVTIKGDKLFLAYRVFTLGNTKIKKYNQRFGTPNGGINEIDIKDYRITINNSRINDCIFKDKNIFNETNPTIINRCLEELIYLEIKNFSNIGINGEPLSLEKEIHNARRTKLNFSKRLNNTLISDYIEVDYILDIDPKYGISKYMVVNSVSKVSLTKTETKLKIMRNPQALGW